MRSEKNATYARNLQTLDHFVMVRFLRDSMVSPSESQVPPFLIIYASILIRFQESVMMFMLWPSFI